MIFTVNIKDRWLENTSVGTLTINQLENLIEMLLSSHFDGTLPNTSTNQGLENAKELMSINAKLERLLDMEYRPVTYNTQVQEQQQDIYKPDLSIGSIGDIGEIKAREPSEQDLANFSLFENAEGDLE